jgi:hypothetical protein
MAGVGCIEGRDLAECRATCGPNTTCDVAGANCACLPAWLDCNADLGRPGGDGCECQGDCEQCGSAIACNPGELRVCQDNRRFCEAFSRVCRSCPSGMYDCDGLSSNECEAARPCEGQIVCDPERVGSCDADDLYCDPPVKLCRECPLGKRDCDGEAENGCETSRLCQELPCDPRQVSSCGSEQLYCDTVRADCYPCANGMSNCDGVGGCESSIPCE